MKTICFITMCLGLLLLAAPAWAQNNIYRATDTNLAGELRTRLQDNTLGDARFLIDANINPSLDPAKGPIYAYLSDSTLMGRGVAITPTTGIMASLGGRWGTPTGISSYMAGTFSTEVDSALNVIDRDTTRSHVFGNNSRIFYWYNNIVDLEDRTKDEFTPSGGRIGGPGQPIKGGPNGFALKNLILDSGKVNLGAEALLGGGVVGAWSNLSWKISSDTNHGTVPMESRFGGPNLILFAVENVVF